LAERLCVAADGASIRSREGDGEANGELIVAIIEEMLEEAIINTIRLPYVGCC